MKSFFLTFRYFIIAITITTAMAIYVGLNQHSSPPIATVTPYPSPLLPNTPEVLIPNLSANEINSGNGRKDNNLLSTPPSSPLIAAKSSPTEIPTHFS